MLTHIHVKNCKSWADSGEVVLAPLTGFFGTNSSGKSSLLQLLLLLKQTIGSDDVLFFGDEHSLVNLGSFNEAIFRYNRDETLLLEFASKLQEPFKIEIPEENLGEYRSYPPDQIDNFTFRTSVREEADRLIVESLSYEVDGSSNNYVRYFIRHHLPIFGITWEAGVLSDDRGLEIGEVKIRNCYGASPSEPHPYQKILAQFSSAFERQFSHVYYLGPARVTPQRRYHWEGTHPHDTGLWGDKTVDALLSSRVLQLKTSDKEDAVPIEEQISKWLHEMELAHSFSLDLSPNGDGRDYEVRIKKDSVSPEVTLVDMGYGLSQFLPVLVLCYYAPEGSTLILEQPGIHLHPKVQSQLADLLIEVVTERNLQILVESHSEHLLNRLQRRIAEEQISVDKTALYFCRNRGSVSACERLEIDEFGNIANWPENFFGNEMGDLLAMAQAQMERQKRAEA